MNDLREAVNELLLFVAARTGLDIEPVTADETAKLGTRMRRFKEAWFPDTDATFAMPPKITTPILLAASLYSLIVPRLNTLRQAAQPVQTTSKGNGLDPHADPVMAEAAPPGLAGVLGAELAPFT